MKKLLWMLLVCFVLCGCGAQETLETVADTLVEPVAEKKQIHITLPEETVLPVMETEEGKLYFCNGFDVTEQIMESGNLDRSIRHISGYGQQELTVMKTQWQGMDCYDFVWTGTDETGQRAGRARILDDGAYHYAVTTMVDEAMAGEYQEIFNGIFESMYLD